MLMMLTTAMMAAMHQKVCDGTCENQEIRERAEQMSSVFCPEVEASDGEQDTKRELSRWRARCVMRMA